MEHVQTADTKLTTERLQEPVADRGEFKITQETVPSGLAIIPEWLLKLVGLAK